MFDEQSQIYDQNEVEIVLEMIRNQYSYLKKTKAMKPFYFKAFETLKGLLTQLDKINTFIRVQEEYKEITLENTIKLLLRCRISYMKLKNQANQPKIENNVDTL